MPQYTIDSPGRLTFGEVTALNVRIEAGRLSERLTPEFYGEAEHEASERLSERPPPYS